MVSLPETSVTASAEKTTQDVQAATKDAQLKQDVPDPSPDSESNTRVLCGAIADKLRLMEQDYY